MNFRLSGTLNECIKKRIAKLKMQVNNILRTCLQGGRVTLAPGLPQHPRQSCPAFTSNFLRHGYPYYPVYTRYNSSVTLQLTR